MKITDLLTVATAFETMLLFSGNVKEIKNYSLEMRTHDCCIYQPMRIPEIRIVKGLTMLHSPKWNTLHDIKQFLFTMIWIIWPAGLLQSGRFVLTFFANGPYHLE